MKMKRLLLPLLIALVATLIFATPVFAYLSNPTSMSVLSVKAFRNVAEDGDIVIVFHSQIAFTSYPSTPASSTIIFRLYDTDGVTLKSTISPYTYAAFANYGYGDEISGFYIPQSANLTWGSAYRIQIYGLPIYFNGLAPANYTMTSSDWNTNTDTSQEAQRADIKDYIFGLCDELVSIYPSYPLKTTTSGAVTLSIYGEAYLVGAIPGLYSMCPGLFFAQVYVPTVMPTQNYTMDESKNAGGAVDSEATRGLNRVAAYIGLSGEGLFTILFLALSIVAMVWIYKKGWGLESGCIVSGGIVILGAVLDRYIFPDSEINNTMWVLMMIGALVAIIALAWYFFHKRSTS